MSLKISQSVFILIGLTFAVLFTLHPMIVSNFELMPGNIGDERFVIYILNHWYNVFSGSEQFFRLNFFYPDKLVLGYSDSFFLFGIIYSIFRLIGCDYFLSLQLLYVFLISVGYISSYFMFRNVFKVNLFFSLVGSVLFVSLNSIQNQFGHAQLLGFYFYPVLVLLLYLYFQSAHKKSKISSWLYLSSFSIFLGLFFFTSYYPAWFFVITCFLYLCVYLLLQWKSKFIKECITEWYFFIKSNVFQLIVCILILFVSLIPFFVTYIPVAFSGYKFMFSEVLYYSPKISDLINVGGSNYLWSPVLNFFKYNYGNVEVQGGFTIFIIIVFGFFLISQRKQNVIMYSLGLTSVLIILLTLRENKYSLWAIIYTLIPGARAIRALGRYMIVAQIIVTIFVIYNCNYLYDNLTSKIRERRNIILLILLILTGLIPLVCLGEQANRGNFHLNRIEQIGFLNKFQSSNSCKVFFVKKVKGDNHIPSWKYQIDALMISMKFGIPTINGYSGIIPKDWKLNDNSSPLYYYYVYKWILLNNIDFNGLCSVDLNSGNFEHISVELLKLQVDKELSVFMNTFDKLYSAALKFLSSGFSTSSLYPQYLEENGYLDKSFGYRPGPANNWTNNGGWIGKWGCPDGKGECFGVGIVGDLEQVKPTIDKYKSDALQIFFPYPKLYDPASSFGTGQLLMIFRVPK
jgi:hypothetical protein